MKTTAAAVCCLLSLSGCVARDLPEEKPPWYGVLVAQVRLRESGRPAAEAITQLLDRGRAVEGVEQIAVADVLPAGESSRGQYRFLVEGLTSAVLGTPRIVSSEYFRLMGMNLLQGRPFVESDQETGPPVVIVNQTMARQAWPEGSPLGKRIRIDRSSSRWTIWLTVVGIYQDLPGAKASPEVYFPYNQVPASASCFVLARASTDPVSVATRLGKALRSADLGLVHELGTLEEVSTASGSH